jgi:hypothetical protein
LLLLGILIGPLVVGNTTMDIQIHDTYYIFGKARWIGNALFIPINVLLLFAWLSHILLRKHSLMSKTWRRVHVIVTLISILTAAVLAMWNYHELFQLRDFSFKNQERDRIISGVMVLNALIFILLQLSFYVATTVLLFKNKSKIRAL